MIFHGTHNCVHASVQHNCLDVTFAIGNVVALVMCFDVLMCLQNDFPLPPISNYIKHNPIINSWLPL